MKTIYTSLILEAPPKSMFLKNKQAYSKIKFGSLTTPALNRVCEKVFHFQPGKNLILAAALPL